MSDDDFRERMIAHMARMEQKVEGLPMIASAMIEHAKMLEKHSEQIHTNTSQIQGHTGAMKMVAGYIVTLTIGIIGWLSSHNIGG